jgi:hypothetical protein
MLLKKSIILTVFLFLAFTVTQAQMVLLSNKTTGKIVPIDSVDRVKLVYLAERTGFQGIYGYVAYGVKGQRYLKGRLVGYTDSSLVIRHRRSWFPCGIKNDTIPLQHIVKVGRGSAIASATTAVVGGMATAATMVLVANTGGAALAIGVGGIAGTAIVEDKLVSPYKWCIVAKE